MHVFINEASLHGQFKDYNIQKCIRVFISAINFINHLNIEKKFFTSANIFFRKIIDDKLLSSNIPSIHSIQSILINNLKNAIKWEDQQLHIIDEIYEYNDNDYASSSVAEIAERKLRENNLKATLINFSESLFGYALQITVIKNFEKEIILDCVLDEDTIERWLISNDLIDHNEQYDISSRIPPRDYQTVLKNPVEFEVTNYQPQHGRKVYRKKNTNELWVVDNSSRHATPKAHIEIFDEVTKRHLGTSLYNVIELRPEYKVENRFMDLT